MSSSTTSPFFSGCTLSCVCDKADRGSRVSGRACGGMRATSLALPAPTPRSCRLDFTPEAGEEQGPQEIDRLHRVYAGILTTVSPQLGSTQHGPERLRAEPVGVNRTEPPSGRLCQINSWGRSLYGCYSRSSVPNGAWRSPLSPGVCVRLLYVLVINSLGNHRGTDAAARAHARRPSKS